MHSGKGEVQAGLKPFGQDTGGEKGFPFYFLKFSNPFSNQF
jgi:hypothetical protein